MKRLSIVILSILLSIYLSLPVMALDLDLVEDEQKEEIKDDFNEEEKKEESENPFPDPMPEPTPTPDELTISYNMVSWDSVSENLISIENEIRGLRKDVQNLANSTFSVSISNINVSDNQVSRNVISTGLQDYDLGEQLQLIGLILAFGALLVYIIHKSIYKWGR